MKEQAIFIEEKPKISISEIKPDMIMSAISTCDITKDVENINKRINLMNKLSRRRNWINRSKKGKR